MSIYKINITSEDSELLGVIEIDTEEVNWDSANTKSILASDIMDEIYRAEKRK